MKTINTLNRKLKIKELKISQKSQAAKAENQAASDTSEAQASSVDAPLAAPSPVDIYNSVMDQFRKALGGHADLIFREFLIGSDSAIKAAVIYLKANTNPTMLYQDVLKPLMRCSVPKQSESSQTDWTKVILDSNIYIGSIREVQQINAAIDDIFDANVILVIAGSPNFFVLNISDAPKRSVEESSTEKTVRSSKEGFIEDIWSNISLIRRTIKDPNLKVEAMKIGVKTKTDVALVYLSNLADPKILAEVKRRLSTIDVDSILGAGYIEQYIEDNPKSPFPQMMATEKPNKAAGNLLEGRIVIVVDRSPQVLMVPSFMIQFFQSTEDYYERTYIGSFVRILRVISFIVAVSATASYIALTTFHPELVPNDLLATLATMRKKVPFSPFVEAVTMEFVIEVLREAGIRMPTPVAATLGVVGGIILGDAAIRSNLVSSPVIVVIVLSTVCTFAIPSYSMSIALRQVRLAFMIMAVCFGAFGTALAWIFVIIHLAKLESFGVPFFSPFGPTRYKDIKDSFIRTPLWNMQKRPVSIPVQDQTRLKNNRKKVKNGGK